MAKSLFLHLKVMKILSWNIQESKKLQAVGDITHYVTSFRPDILFVLETMTSNATSKIVTKGFRFQKMLIIEPINHSRWIWVCWNNDNIQVLSHVLTDRCAHLKVLYKPTTEQILVFGAYLTAQTQNIDEFWDAMTVFYDNFTMPWILLGDFSELLSTNDK